MPPSNPGTLQRLQRVMARAGVASRRACEDLIAAGRVRVNGAVARDMPVMVDPRADRIEVDGRPIRPSERHVYVMLNKPKRTVTTARDEDGAARRTVVDMVAHPSGVRLFPVGRLDFDTMGLLLLTNDGELAERLTHARFGVPKTYLATVRGVLSEQEVEQLRAGVMLADRKDGRTVGAVRAGAVGMKLVQRGRDESVVQVTLAEGRNRQVRRMLAAVGRPVKKLERVAVGPVRLKGLRRGEWRELTAGELRALRKACKLLKPRPDSSEAATSADIGAGGFGRGASAVGGAHRGHEAWDRMHEEPDAVPAPANDGLPTERRPRRRPEPTVKPVPGWNTGAAE